MRVGLAVDTATLRANPEIPTVLKAARTILTGVGRVKNPAGSGNSSKIQRHQGFPANSARAVERPLRGGSPRRTTVLGSRRMARHGGFAELPQIRGAVGALSRMETMMTRLTLAVLAAGLVLARRWRPRRTSPRRTPRRSPGADDGRYTFHRVEDSFVRLDGRTGQVSVCGRESRRLDLPGGAGRARRARGDDRPAAGRQRRAQEGIAGARHGAAERGQGRSAGGEGEPTSAKPSDPARR